MAEIRNFMIALLLFSGIMIAMTGFYGSMITETQNANPSGCTWCGNLNEYEYSNFSESNLNTSIIQITDKVEEMKNQTMEFHEWGIIGDFVAILKAGVDSVVLVFDSIVLSQNMIADFAVILGFPAWVSSIFIGIVLIVIVFGVIYVLTGRRV